MKILAMKNGETYEREPGRMRDGDGSEEWYCDKVDEVRNGR